MTRCRAISPTRSASAETTLLRMTAAYSMFANGGKKIEATLIDRIQDRRGKTIFRHDKRDCAACQVRKYSAKAWSNLNSSTCASR